MLIDIENKKEDSNKCDEAQRILRQKQKAFNCEKQKWRSGWNNKSTSR